VPSKLLLLGLDAAEPSLIRRWAANGKLPALRALMDRGTSGSISGVEGFYIGSTWPSFYTGLNPAGHGFHRIDQLASGSYDSFRPLDVPGGVGGTPFWKAASDAGRRVAVLDVPLIRIDPNLNGAHIVEWGVHDSIFGFHTTPAGLADEVLALVGEHPLRGDCDAERTTADDFERFVAALELGAAKRTQLTLELLERDDWDLFVQVFSEPHCVGHQCWHLHDPAHPAYDHQLLGSRGDPIERVYRAIDRAVGTVVEHAGNARILVFSLHGMNAFRGASFLLHEILYRLGVTTRPRLLRRLHSRLTRTANESVFRSADVSTSKCFPIHNGFPVSGIRLNLVGREPAGVLRPGADADEFCGQLAQALLAIIDERTNAPLIASVDRTDSLYTGANRDALPDLLVQWSDAVPTGTLAYAGGRGAGVRARSPTIGLVEGWNDWARTGEHVPTGMFVYAGPGVPSGSREAPVRLMDFHPTLCALMNLPAQAVDGDVIRELVVPLS
jgi:predicted AlkP superfamily phosphohydrolase/phosphomutase